MHVNALRYVLENSINGIVVLDHHNQLQFFNKRAEEILGVSNSKNEWNEAIQLFQKEMAKAFPDSPDSNGTNMEFNKLQYKNKTLVASLITIPKSIEFDGKAYIFQDVSKYESIVEEIGKYAELNTRLDAIIQSSYDGIYVTDGEANTLLVNKAYERITGVKAEEVMGRNMKDIVESGIINRSGSLLVISKRKQVTLRQVMKAGKETLITSTPVFSPEGDIIYVVTNVRDLSELVQLQNELMDSKALNERYLSELEHVKGKLLEIPEIVIRDQRMYRVVETILNVAKVDSTVLLHGETGVGKGQFTRLLHQKSNRSENAFIEINCGAIPASLIESELFGYEKGAFTGALAKGKMGMFELADQGTIVLDEVSELPLDIQVKLLKVLEDRKIFRVGGEKAITVDVRVIAATNRDLKDMVNKGRFRDDLYYRLNVVPILIYPLRERPDDIVPLCLKFLEEFNHKYGMKKYFAPEALRRLTTYDWPGNVRELKNLVERMVAISKEDQIPLSLLPDHVVDRKTDPSVLEGLLPDENALDDLTLKEATCVFERQIIHKTVERTGSMKKASEILGVNPSTLYRKLNGERIQ